MKIAISFNLIATIIAIFLSVRAIYAEDSRIYTLRDCVAIAMKQSPLIRSSESDTEVAQASIGISKGALLPKLNLNASYIKENQNIPYIPAQATNIPAKFSDEIYSWNLYLKIPLYEGGRLSEQVDISEMEKKVQQARKDFNTQDLIASITNTFNKILQFKELKKAYEKTVEALAEQRKNVELLVNIGRLPQIDLLRVEVQLASEKQNLIKTVEAINRTKNMLAFLMGVPANDISDIAGTLSPVSKFDETHAYELIKSRPDIIALSQKIEQAKKKITVATGKRYPSVAFIANYGDRAGQGLHEREEVWEAGIVATIIIFDGGIISSEIKREEALYKKALEELRLAELKAHMEVDNALSLLREAENRLSVAQKAVRQAEESVRIEELKYKTGAGTITDVLLAQSALSLAYANYYQALYDQTAALTEYKLATRTLEVIK